MRNAGILFLLLAFRGYAFIEGSIIVLNLRLILVAGILYGLSPDAMAQPVEDGAIPQFVTSGTCANCHKDVMSKWRDSHHAWAWRAPDAKTVLGDFEDAIFEHRGVITRFTRHGGAFLVETDGGEGYSRMFEVIGTAGITPLQQYLVETEPGRVQVLDVAWDDINKRWSPSNRARRHSSI